MIFGFLRRRWPCRLRFVRVGLGGYAEGWGAAAAAALLLLLLLPSAALLFRCSLLMLATTLCCLMLRCCCCLLLLPAAVCCCVDAAVLLRVAAPPPTLGRSPTADVGAPYKGGHPIRAAYRVALLIGWAHPMSGATL